MPALARRPRHLVDDELLWLRLYGREHPFRLRIWRCDGEPALVLVDQVPGSLAPCLASERLANLIKAVYLAHTAKGMFYFEREESGRLLSVTFEILGHGERFRLIKPHHSRLEPEFLDEFLGDALKN
jgi:hypothetical protein